MSFKEFCESEEKLFTEDKPLRWWVVVFVWACGAVCGVVTVSGCNTVVQGVNGLAKDTLIAAAAVKATTDGGLGGSLPASGQGSMETDHQNVISFEQAQQLAGQYGYQIEGN